MDNKGSFGIYDESFDLDRDGELNATEFDYMMEEYEKAGLSSDSEDDDSYLFDDENDEDFEDEEDDWDDDEEDEDPWDDSEDGDWDDESDDY